MIICAKFYENRTFAFQEITTSERTNQQTRLAEVNLSFMGVWVKTEELGRSSTWKQTEADVQLTSC